MNFKASFQLFLIFLGVAGTRINAYDRPFYDSLVESIEPGMGAGFCSDLTTGEAHLRFINLFSNKTHALGVISDNRYTRSLGFITSQFSINVPKYSEIDYPFLLLGEHNLSSLESERHIGNERGYLYFLPKRESIDKREYMCAVMLTVHGLTKEGAYKAGEAVFNNFKENRSFNKMLFSKKTTFDDFPAFFAVSYNQKRPDYAMVFYHISYHSRLHVCFVQLIPANQLPKNLNALKDESYFSDLHEWMYSFSFE